MKRQVEPPIISQPGVEQLADALARLLAEAWHRQTATIATTPELPGAAA